MIYQYEALTKAITSTIDSPWMTATDRLRLWRRARNGHAARMRPSGCKLLARPWSQSNGAAQCACGCLPRTAVACIGCCTSLLYGTTGAGKKTVKVALTPALLHSRLRRLSAVMLMLLNWVDRLTLGPLLVRTCWRFTRTSRLIGLTHSRRSAAEEH
jgi:hypothetical protein